MSSNISFVSAEADPTLAPANPRKRKFPMLSSDHGFEMATVVVGEGKKQRRFTVHRRLLAEASECFERCLNGRFREADGEIHLKQHDPDAFEFVYRWLYSGNACPPADTVQVAGASNCEYNRVLHRARIFWLSLLSLSTETMLDDLKAYAYSQFTTQFSAPPTRRIIQIVFAHDFPTPILQDFLVDVTAFVIMKGSKRTKPTDPDILKDSWSRHPDFAMRVLNRTADLTFKDAWQNCEHPSKYLNYSAAAVFGFESSLYEDEPSVQESKRRRQK
jgi:hypothetical protein